MSYFLKWLGLNSDCKAMMYYETMMLAHYDRAMGNKAVPIFQQAVNADAKRFIEAQSEISAAVYAMP